MSDDKINPFQAPQAKIPIPLNLVDTELKSKNGWLVALKWTVICTISAAPSFFVAMTTTGDQAPFSSAVGMLLAILLFICVYTYAEMTPFIRRLMLDRRKKLSARITYGIRMGISIIFPIALPIDFMIGIVSVSMTSALLGGGERGFTGGKDLSLAVTGWHFVTTILDGLIMNFIVFGLMIIVFGICVLAMEKPQYVRPGASKHVPK